MGEGAGYSERVRRCARERYSVWVCCRETERDGPESESLPGGALV
jgi:hypothetical protein